jgi:NTE family protein
MEIIEKLRNARKLGLALGGGGARGFAHIGVLKVLENFDIAPKIITGTSMGAIIGALYASGKDWQYIYDLAEDIEWHKLIDLSAKGGLLEGDALKKGLRNYLPETFEELEIPFAAIATDVETGAEVVITTGDLITSLRASISLPGIFAPVCLDGRYLIDGGVVNNVPATPARVLGADRIISVDVGPRADRPISVDDDRSWWEKLRDSVNLEKRSLTVDLLLKSIDIMQSRMTWMLNAASSADVFISIPLPNVHLESLNKIEEAVSAGEKETIRALVRD